MCTYHNEQPAEIVAVCHKNNNIYPFDMASDGLCQTCLRPDVKQILQRHTSAARAIIQEGKQHNNDTNPSIFMSAGGVISRLLGIRGTGYVLCGCLKSNETKNIDPQNSHNGRKEGRKRRKRNYNSGEKAGYLCGSPKTSIRSNSSGIFKARNKKLIFFINTRMWNLWWLSTIRITPNQFLLLDPANHYPRTSLHQLMKKEKACERFRIDQLWELCCMQLVVPCQISCLR